MTQLWRKQDGGISTRPCRFSPPPRDLSRIVDDLWRAPGLQRVHFASKDEIIGCRKAARYGTRKKKKNRKEVKEKVSKEYHDIPVAQADVAARSEQNQMPRREQPR